jgi:hypothetical protein
VEDQHAHGPAAYPRRPRRPFGRPAAQLKFQP